MIIMQVMGGLGNQIFQWAYGKCLSKIYDVPFYLDASFYDRECGATLRSFSLNKFPNISYDLIEYPSKTPQDIIIIYDNFHYNKIDYDPSHNYYLGGYWQSEKYFIDIENTIRDNLEPTESIKDKLLSAYPVSNSVSIHIRRTDYLALSTIHPVQSISYYEEALSLVKYKNILVFSDDIDWCKQNLKFQNMIFVENNDNIEDMWLMSLCEHNIIANSSFSWWGAWLNKNKNKTVIAPSKWFGEGYFCDIDIVPNNWIKL